MENRYSSVKTALRSRIYARAMLFCVAILGGGHLAAQAPNDLCENAQVLQPTEIGRDFCAAVGQPFTTTVGATAGTLSGASCFGTTAPDVWFRFTAIGTDVSIKILGSGAGGTLRAPEVAMYQTDDCQSYAEYGCASDRVDAQPNNGSVELYKGGLSVGSSYAVRILGGATGTFQICINNYNAPRNPTSDCISSSILCDKSAFAVQSVTGAGNDRNELSDAPCLGGGVNAESNSTWFKWTCEESGSLTFSIIPTRIIDDIDFAVYELDGTDNCTAGRRLLRCMASGPENQTTGEPRRCAGPTGLRDGETDITEPPGCSSASQNNFLAPIQMIAGRSYAIGINNFTSRGNGFSMEFGGTGTFQGPRARIRSNKPSKRICLGEDIIFQDSSTFMNGRIVEWKWNFGPTASIQTATGRGPYRVFYKRPGWKTISLTVTSEKGCFTTAILDSIYVAPLTYDSSSTQPTCAGGTNGTIRARVTNCGRAPILYNWEGLGFSATRDSLSNLGPGRYQCVITDSSRSYFDTLRFRLGFLELALDTAIRTITQPLCYGLMNGRVELNLANGDGPYEYRFNNTFWTRTNFLAGIGEGTVTVEVRDRNLCKGTFSFDLLYPPRLEVAVDTTNITCFGLRNGRGRAFVSGGVGNYQYNWSNGATAQSAVNLAAGNYNITVLDGNGCFTFGGLQINEPPELRLDSFKTMPAKCFGDSTAGLILRGNGGTPPYRYSIDGIRFQADTFKSIPARTYNVVLRDSTGCRITKAINVPSAPPLQVSAGPDLRIDLGFSTQLRAIVVPSNRIVTYKWTPKDSMLCDSCVTTFVAPTRTTLYRVTVRDTNGCSANDDVLVNVVRNRPIFIPNSFSPNNDGINDRFTAFGNQAAIRVEEVQIFNRWGDRVWAARDIALGDERVGWDGSFNGSPLDPDVFVYYFKIRFLDGETETYRGDVTLLK
ncbi:MAG: hypothetical protein RL757_622 [Bacteroidota bacterium]|jgi:gliding motility-associated-like protein